jgi:antirestriction protein ArdC
MLLNQMGVGWEANHESAHFTKHPSRLNRDLGRKQWGDEGYAREELVAEIAIAPMRPSA